MYYLQVFFRNRGKPLLLPVSEQICRNFEERLPNFTSGMIGLNSAYGHEVWLNTESIQYAQCLLEWILPN
ncbi:MAG: hypothetical protein JWO94_1990 [Verrucomicrobiaceae bacterium]|nr:hypothetical protein [Verrucomicrobiaceae bacterium]